MMNRHRTNIHEPGHAHELTFSCYKNYPFLKAERCCQWLAESIDKARQELKFRLWAYVFMHDHVHLVIYPEAPKADISTIRKAIKRPVAQLAIAFLSANSPEWLPKITRQRGDKTEHLFWQSGGGYDRNVITPKTLLSMIEYTHENPIRNKFVQNRWEWRWSSAAWYDRGQAIPLRVDPIPIDWLE